MNTEQDAYTDGFYAWWAATEDGTEMDVPTVPERYTGEDRQDWLQGWEAAKTEALSDSATEKVEAKVS